MAEPIILIDKNDPSQKPKLYACPTCGHAYSPAIYLAKDEVAHQTAYDAAANCYNCRTHNICSDCGAECEKLYTKCPDCRHKATLASAETIPATEVEQCFGFDSGDFYQSVGDAAEAGEKLVNDASFRPFRLDPDATLEWVLDDHHEDASVDDFQGVPALLAAIAAFNEAQTSGSYDLDRKRVADISHLSVEGSP